MQTTDAILWKCFFGYVRFQGELHAQNQRRWNFCSQFPNVSFASVTNALYINCWTKYEENCTVGGSSFNKIHLRERYFWNSKVKWFSNIGSQKCSYSCHSKYVYICLFCHFFDTIVRLAKFETNLKIYIDVITNIYLIKYVLI